MYTLNCKGRLLVIEEPVVMGILNITPDSFYAGSRMSAVESAVNKARQMVADGATIVDIGGQSTRPGSERIGATEELDRILPVVEAIKKEIPELYVSIDTYHALVAEIAVKSGADLINDISAGDMDEQMLETVARLQVPYVAMHMKGTPETMQLNASYEHVTTEVLDYFIHKADACRKSGITDLILDPGFGFGKTATHNFQLLKHLEAFSILPYPLLVGISRKATIYKTLSITPEEALNGTTVLNTVALQKGASILRVHDVKEAKEAIQLISSLKQA